MTDEENRKRSIDENVNFIKQNICDCTGDKSYVFISYKSDDWETVLHDIVYRLVKDYGLNVYFDGSFDSHNSLWINQFPENMGNYKCKGVIAFFDDKYATSYATLMELLYSQTKKAAMGKANPNGLPIVPVDLTKLTNITGEQGQRDTGLGVETYEDGSVNVNAANEMDLFSKSFRELVKRCILDDAQYIWEPGERLNAMACSQIVRELKAYKKINENYYSSGMSLDGIVGSIKNACGSDVFSQSLPNGEKITVTFLSGDKRWSEIIKRGDIITEPDHGQIDGCEFKGWFVSDTDKEWFFSNPVDSDIEIRAKWDKYSPADLHSVNENTTLAEFEKMCEQVNFCIALGDARGKTEHGGKGLFDYLMAALLRGCDADIFDKKNHRILKLSGYNYNKYAVAEDPDDPKTSDITYPWTWTTACRKCIKKEDIPERFLNEKGKIKSGKLEDFNTIFENLDPNMVIGDVLAKFKSRERGFDTKNNELILSAWNLINNICLGKKDLSEIL